MTASYKNLNKDENNVNGHINSTSLRRGPFTTTKQVSNSPNIVEEIKKGESSAMALAGARQVFCQIRSEKKAAAEVQKVRVAESSGKVVLQPRVCNLRSFGDDRSGVVLANSKRENEVSNFFETLSDYVESSKKSHDFEIISGRLAMIVFAGTIGMEVITGNSVLRKMDLQGIEEAVGICLAAITSAAIFAWFTSNRNRVGRIFTVGCNTFIDSLIDQIIDGLFYDTDIND